MNVTINISEKEAENEYQRECAKVRFHHTGAGRLPKQQNKTKCGKRLTLRRIFWISTEQGAGTAFFRSCEKQTAKPWHSDDRSSDEEVKQCQITGTGEGNPGIFDHAGQPGRYRECAEQYGDYGDG